MESILCAIIVVLLCFGGPISDIKTAESILWLAISFSHSALEPNEMTKALSYVRYAAYALIGLFFTYVVAVLATPIILLFVRPDNNYLPRWLCWFQTFDASVDQGWLGNYFTNTNPSSWWQRIWSYSGSGTPTGLNRFLLRVRWLWRNPAYGFDLWPLGMAYNPDDWIVKVCDVANGQLIKFYAETKDGLHFSYCDSSNRKFGWKLWWALGSDFKLQTLDQFNHVATPISGYDQSKRIMFVFTP